MNNLSDKAIEKLRADLLCWYDASGRSLPWRIRPKDRQAGEKPDTYAIWLSEIILQQTTITHGAPYWRKFLTRFPTVCDLASAERDEIMTMWAGLGYYARARNLHLCAQIICKNYNGQFPQSEALLLKLPGIGPYTAATMAAICFNEATNIVDGNVERVIARIFAVKTPLFKAKKRLRDLAAPLADPLRPGDYGQALMDLGATICTPRAPDCADCPWRWSCAADKEGDPQIYPIKTKKARPVRYGAAFVLMSDGKVLLRKRPDKGLLGGMMELPGTDWEEKAPSEILSSAPVKADWERCGQVRHVFTHFELRLDICKANIIRTNLIAPDIGGIWAKLDELDRYALPSVMKKAIKRAT